MMCPVLLVALIAVAVSRETTQRGPVLLAGQALFHVKQGYVDVYLTYDANAGYRETESG